MHPRATRTPAPARRRRTIALAGAFVALLFVTMTLTPLPSASLGGTTSDVATRPLPAPIEAPAEAPAEAPVAAPERAPEETSPRPGALDSTQRQSSGIERVTERMHEAAARITAACETLLGIFVR
ncbi:MAG: hypothetical protein ACTH31_04790 [Pseudoclavibacter sp.]